LAIELSSQLINEATNFTPVLITEKIKLLPTSPGVYQFISEEGNVIYVGKAKNLRSRVNSYFSKDGGHSGRTRVMVRKITDLKFIVVGNELDALLLENNLIKQLQPRYNVMLKDDKTYPWLCIKKEPFPRVFSTRTKIEDGSEYYGPYASVKTMHTLLRLIRRLYKIRTCKYDLSAGNIEKGKFKVCLEYHIGNCLGPCEGLQSREEYDAQMDEIRTIIKGNISAVQKELKLRMNEFAERMEFEKAQYIKDKLETLQYYRSKSSIVNPAIGNVDVLAVASDLQAGYVNYMKVVDGAIVQSHTMHFRKKLEESDQELLLIALAELKGNGAELAKELLLPLDLEVELPDHKMTVPKRGDKLSLVELSARNAKYIMLDKQKQSRFTDPEQHTQRILEQIKKDLRLRELPLHIEGFDNSNLMGTNAVSACVVFRDGKPSKKDYRHFNVKTVTGPDDFASMREVVYRRYKRLKEEGASLPQLIVIDGGKGQLSAALESLEALDLRGKIAIIGIAKRLEEIYYPGDTAPLYIDKRSDTLKVLQHIRNESHRFGITHHRNKRSKATIKTALTDIPGIGPEMAARLLGEFKSVAGIRKAPFGEIEKAVGSSRAKAVRDWVEKLEQS
jgi:excinuclease ABC subunit C